MGKYVESAAKEVQNSIQGVNLARKSSQEQFYPELLRLQGKRDQLIYKCWQINGKCNELEKMALQNDTERPSKRELDETESEDVNRKRFKP